MNEEAEYDWVDIGPAPEGVVVARMYDQANNRWYSFRNGRTYVFQPVPPPRQATERL